MGSRFLFSLTLIVALSCTSGAEAKDKSRAEDKGETLFKQTCASCHPGGANLVKPSKTIYDSKQLNSIVTFKKYLESPAGHMPYYKFIVKDKKLLEALYKYTKTLKKHPIG